jgi:exopolysaccharide biosynthesis WecB/TagA/CpsF family protein
VAMSIISCGLCHLERSMQRLSRRFARRIRWRFTRSLVSIPSKRSSTRNPSAVTFRGYTFDESCMETVTTALYAPDRRRIMSDGYGPQGSRTPRKPERGMATLASDTVALFGMPITNVTMDEAVARVEEYILSGKSHQIATANLDFARNSLRDPYLQRIICECSMVLPDGAPMLWAANLFGSPLRERVTGVDLIPQLARLSATHGYGIYLLGSSEESSEAAAQALAERFPGVRIVGRHCPAVAPLREMNHEEMIRMIIEAAPQIILVGFGNPKQEIWIHRHKDRLPAAVVIGIGGSLDMIAGSTRMALPHVAGAAPASAALYPRCIRADYPSPAGFCGESHAAVRAPAARLGG